MCNVRLDFVGHLERFKDLELAKEALEFELINLAAAVKVKLFEGAAHEVMRLLDASVQRMGDARRPVGARVVAGAHPLGARRRFSTRFWLAGFGRRQRRWTRTRRVLGHEELAPQQAALLASVERMLARMPPQGSNLVAGGRRVDDDRARPRPRRVVMLSHNLSELERRVLHDRGKYVAVGDFASRRGFIRRTHTRRLLQPREHELAATHGRREAHRESDVGRVR